MIIIPSNTITSNVLFDASSGSTYTTGTSGTTNTHTWSHTSSDTASIALVGLRFGALAINYASVTTTATYGGVTMTPLPSYGTSSTDAVKLFYLISPPTGTRTVTVTMTNNTSAAWYSRAAVATYVGPVTGVGTAVNASGSSPSVTVGTGKAFAVFNAVNATPAMTASGSSTRRFDGTPLFLADSTTSTVSGTFSPGCSWISIGIPII